MQIEKKPKIGILASASIYPNMQAELYNFARLVGDKYNLQLITGGEVPKRIQNLYSVFRVKKAEVDPYGLRHAFIGASVFVRERDPDILMNIGKQFPLGVAISLVGEWKRVDTIVRITSDYFRAPKLKKRFWERSKSILAQKVICNKIYKLAEKIVPLGVNMKKKLIGNGHSNSKLSIIPQPFDPNLFNKTRSEEKKKIKESLNLDANRRTVLTVGRLTWEKGADRVRKIIEGVRRRAGEETDVQFCLVGAGEADILFDSLPSKLVTLPGFVQREDVHRYFQAADLLIHPTRHDSLPNVILEAIAARVPVMASPVGEIPHYVKRTSARPRDYVNYILEGQWTPDPIPDWYDKQVQKQRYIELIDGVLTS